MPDDPALLYVERDAEGNFLQGEARLLQVPLTLVAKAVMRSLDVLDAHGQPMPVLGREDDGLAAWASLVSLVNAPTPMALAVEAALHDVVFEPPDVAAVAVQRLFGPADVVGSGGGLLRFHPVEPLVEDLVRTLAGSFILIALLPKEAAGTRQVLKYSAHWQVDTSTTRLSVWRRLAAAGGYLPADMVIAVSGAEDARSYHLEVQAPAGLACDGLRLPPDPSSGREVSADTQFGSVAHAVGYYPTGVGSDDEAVLSLRVPGGALHRTTTLVAAFTAAVFLLAELLPGARVALLAAPEGAAALLLAAPAVSVALLARSGESAIAAKVLMPLRAVVLACATALIAATGSLVGHLHEPYFTLLWQAGAVGSTALTLVLLGRGPWLWCSGHRHNLTLSDLWRRTRLPSRRTQREGAA